MSHCTLPTKKNAAFSGGSGKEPTCQHRRGRFDHCVRKIPWRRKWQPTPVFLPGKSHGQGSLMGYIQSMGLQKSQTRLTGYPVTWRRKQSWAPAQARLRTSGYTHGHPPNGLWTLCPVSIEMAYQWETRPPDKRASGLALGLSVA